jgi:hypothetical protein
LCGCRRRSGRGRCGGRRWGLGRAAAARALGSRGAPIGTGWERAFAGTVVVGVVAVTAWAGCLLLMPKMRAVVAAPTAADVPATAARVNLLIVGVDEKERNE